MKRYAALFVGLGAVSYGIPASIFKLAHREAVGNGPLLVWTFLLACVGLHLLEAGRRRLQPGTVTKTTAKEKWQVIAAGTASGFTNTFYILALNRVPVAVAAVMIMQSVWLSIVIGAVMKRQWPSRLQLISVVVVLAGTVLAAGLLPITAPLSLLGIGLGFMSGLSYALTIQFTGNVGRQFNPLDKARLMSIGALLLIILVWGVTLFNGPVNQLAAIKWGSLIAFSSMIFPLIVYSIYMPKLALGVGPILSSLELPASILFAFILLGETVDWIQLVGVVLILGAVTLSNLLPTMKRRWQDVN